jgi:hypothetical protein
MCFKTISFAFFLLILFPLVFIGLRTPGGRNAPFRALPLLRQAIPHQKIIDPPLDIAHFSLSMYAMVKRL